MLFVDGPGLAENLLAPFNRVRNLLGISSLLSDPKADYFQLFTLNCLFDSQVFSQTG